MPRWLFVTFKRKVNQLHIFINAVFVYYHILIITFDGVWWPVCGSAAASAACRGCYKAPTTQRSTAKDDLAQTHSVLLREQTLQSYSDRRQVCASAVKWLVITGFKWPCHWTMASCFITQLKMYLSVEVRDCKWSVIGSRPSATRASFDSYVLP